MKPIKYSVLLFFSINFFIVGCQTHSDTNASLPADKYKVADDFDVQIAAREPLIEAPVLWILITKAECG